MSQSTPTRHFLTLLDFSRDELKALITQASKLKKLHKNRELYTPLQGRVLGMIFEKSSTRTRVSFEAGIAQLGGSALFLSPRDTQLGRGEPIEDTARVLSQMVDCIMIRTFDHETVETFANNSEVPVINGLTDLYHPCQLIADMQTWQEHRGDMAGKTATWVGDGNNMCHSWINAARQFDFTLNIACPEGYEPDSNILNAAGDHAKIIHDPKEAAKNSDLIATDVWASMGQEEEQAKREKAFSGYQVNAELMAKSADDSLFMHCLPAHRGEEVTAEVIDNPNTIVWDEAGNRMHAQKALLEFLLT